MATRSGGGRSKKKRQERKEADAQRMIAATRSGRAVPEQTDFSPSENGPRNLGVGESAVSVTNVSADRTRRTPRTSASPTGKVGDAGILAGTAVEESPEDRSRRMSEITKELEESLSAKDVEMAAAAEALKNKPSAPATSLRPTSDLPEAPDWGQPSANPTRIRLLHSTPFVCASCKLPSTHSGGTHISRQPACSVCTEQNRPNITPYPIHNRPELESRSPHRAGPAPTSTWRETAEGVPISAPIDFPDWVPPISPVDPTR